MERRNSNSPGSNRGNAGHQGGPANLEHDILQNLDVPMEMLENQVCR